MTLRKLPFAVIRHGQTDANRDGRIAGRTEAKLTQTGRRDACALTQWNWPGNVVLFTSPQQRAQDTARFGFPGYKPVVLNDLRERDWGLLEGCPVSELPPREQTPEAGEVWSAMLNRVADAITQAHEYASGRLSVLVAHSGVIRAARHLTGGTAHGPSPANTTPYLFVPYLCGWREVMPNKKDKKWIV